MEYSLYNFCKHGNVSFELNILKQVIYIYKKSKANIQPELSRNKERKKKIMTDI